MGKGIVIVDIRETCLDCDFCYEIDEGTLACCTRVHDENSIYNRRVIDNDYCQDKPDWCPIKPVPEKKELKGDVSNVKNISEESIRIGWNECIDEILKE